MSYPRSTLVWLLYGSRPMPPWLPRSGHRGWPTTPPWPREWVPGMHGECRIEATARYLPKPLAHNALGALQMAFDGCIWWAPIDDALMVSNPDCPNFKPWHKSTTPCMAFSIACVIVSLTLFWGVCWVTLMMNNFIISVTSWPLVLKCASSYLGIGMFNSIMRCMLMLHNSLQVD